ncbi:alanine racemase [Salimicrobium halophilum]|uniref:Alanine racemase n=1 Tax=Salimicrobium halophilum TaxID=86666 RepID=A0A1G8VPZ1_9BACI|nr:alanine racemase [Salimicrobium halophilum]SDJ68003.1 alanine racemase [Salimicrobium halophilum]
MEEKFYRDSWAEIDLDAIANNVRELKHRLSEETGVYAVVKADGYGHGDVQVARAALEAGAERLAVALLDEALRLRKAGFTAPILVMGYTRPEDAAVAAEHDITVTAYQEEWVDKVEGTGKHPVKVHLKMDTGMGRIGVRTKEEMDGVLSAIRRNENIELTGVFTHFAKADDEDLSYYEEQNRRLEGLLGHFTTQWTKEVTVHTGNSAASMRFPEQMHHFVRFGISMYGLYPSGDVKKEKPISLKPAFSLHSNLVHVKKLEAGESISYGTTYETKGEEWIGTVPLGYADGWIRKLQGAEVLVDGKRCEIVGRICMDQFMIRLDKSHPVGTEVVLIGKQGEDEIETDEIADHLDTINYEIPCIISSRVPRVYKKGGETTAISHRLQAPIV